jgi:hypothetical protein
MFSRYGKIRSERLAGPNLSGEYLLDSHSAFTCLTRA